MFSGKKKRPTSAATRMKIAQALKGKRKALGKKAQQIRGGLAADRVVAKGTLARGFLKAGLKKPAGVLTRSAIRDAGRTMKSRQASVGATNSYKKYNKLRNMLNKPR